MTRIAGHGLWIVLLTLVTQIGGLAWLIAVMTRRRWLVFALAYGGLGLGAAWISPLAGRVPLPCTGEALRMQSLIFCALNRHYAAPELAEALRDTAAAMAARHPGTQTLILDAGFPFLDGFPLLPHLSHGDGRKADLAFYYVEPDGTALPGRTRSPIGYVAFEPGPTRCPPAWLTMRWDLHWLQGTWPQWRPDRARMRTLMGLLSRDARIGKILLEPHLTRAWGVAHPKVRFQGCRAARHDDHIHVQL